MDGKITLATIAVLVLANFTSAGINDGLQAYYTFNGNATDATGHGYNGTVYGATLTSDHLGNSNSAYYFDGSNDYIGLGNPAGLNFVGNISIAAWVRPDVIGGVDINRNIVAHGYGGSPTNEVYLRTANNGQYEIGSYIENDLNTGRAEYVIPPADQGSWVYLVGLYNGSAWKLYRNGMEVASQQIVTGAIQVNANWVIGASGYGTSRFFTGAIDEVRIYDRALSASEVQELYQIPEPATLLLIILGGLAVRKKR